MVSAFLSSSPSSTRSPTNSWSLALFGGWRGTGASINSVAATATTDVVVPEQESSKKGNKRFLHFVILVHGWMGNDMEMGYIEEALQKQSNSFVEEDANNADDDEQQQDKQRTSKNNNRRNFIIYSPKSNVGKTSDGIELGGTRLANEIMNLIKNHTKTATSTTPRRTSIKVEEEQQEQQQHDSSEEEKEKDNKKEDEEELIISLSFVGNSLGGLYSRFALSKLDWSFVHNNDNKNKRIHTIKPLIFCTTATPHLGVSKNTYLPLPRFMEYGIGNMLDKTGRDLFLLTPLIQSMSKSKHFMHPLSRFKKRVSYANSYQTDFQVPTKTAAFLSDNSDYIHHILNDDYDIEYEQEEEGCDNNNPADTDAVADNNIDVSFSSTGSSDSSDTTISAAASSTCSSSRDGMSSSSSRKRRRNSQRNEFIALKVETRRSHNFDSLWDGGEQESKEQNINDSSNNNKVEHQQQQQNTEKSNKNDDVDMSHLLDSLGWVKVFCDVREKIPVPSLPLLGGSWFNKREEQQEQDEKSWKTSKELISTMTIDKDNNNRIHFPLGHTVLVANSKSNWYAKLNANGRPIIDYLAENLIEDIISYEDQLLGPSTS